MDIDIGKIVRIHVHEGVEQNAGRYHDVIKKFKKKKAGALAAMKMVPVKKTVQKREFVPMKKLWYHRFRWFVTSDGIVVLGGRDASQNEELVKKYMTGGDLFVHADVHGASVVIVKGKTGRIKLRFAIGTGQYAARRSKRSNKSWQTRRKNENNRKDWWRRSCLV